MIAVYVIVALVIAASILSAMSARVIRQYERVVVFELGRVKGEARGPGLIFIFPFVDRVHRVSLRIVTMPIQSQGISQTTLRAVVGRHTLDETLSETEAIHQNVREILDVQTEERGVKVTVVELRAIQLPESMTRAIDEHDRRARRLHGPRDQSRRRARWPGLVYRAPAYA